LRSEQDDRTYIFASVAEQTTRYDWWLGNPVRIGGPAQRERLGVEKSFVAVEHTRDISEKSMVHNGATPAITVDPETHEVTVTRAPAEVPPMAERYFPL
jgi:hypothetical protein